MSCRPSYDGWNTWFLRTIIATLLFVGGFAAYNHLAPPKCCCAPAEIVCQ